MNMQIFLKWIGLVISGVLAFFSPILSLVYIIIACVVFDLITAIGRDITKYTKRNPKSGFFNSLRVIRSHKIRRTALKFFFYILFIALIFGVEFCFFGAGTILLPKIAAGMVVFGELVSITANLDIIMGTTLFTKILTRIRKVFESRIEKNITDEYDKRDIPSDESEINNQ